MFVDIHVEPYEIKKQVEYTIEFPEYGKFPNSHHGVLCQ